MYLPKFCAVDFSPLILFNIEDVANRMLKIIFTTFILLFTFICGYHISEKPAESYYNFLVKFNILFFFKQIVTGNEN